MCTYVSPSTTSVVPCALGGQRGCRIPSCSSCCGTRVADGYEPPYGCLELNPGRLEGQTVLLTSELLLQPLDLAFLKTVTYQLDRSSLEGWRSVFQKIVYVLNQPPPTYSIFFPIARIHGPGVKEWKRDGIPHYRLCDSPGTVFHPVPWSVCLASLEDLVPQG